MRVYHRCTTETRFHSGAGNSRIFLNSDCLESWRQIETSCNSVKLGAEMTLNLWVHGSSPWRVTILPSLAPATYPARGAPTLEGTGRWRRPWVFRMT